MELTFEAVEEPVPGPSWAAAFRARWPATRAWYLSEGLDARPTVAEGRAAIVRHMPELATTYDRICGLVGDVPLAHRCLSLWNPPPVIPSCSQVAWRGPGGPALVRNYDFDPALVAARIVSGRWLGRRTIAMEEGSWGCLDGMNEDGLAASLTFGGRRGTGCGFSVVLVLRYVLETCRTVAEATRALARIPVFMAQNVTVIDARGDAATVFLGHDRPPVVVADRVATNHQEAVVWAAQATAVRTVERHAFLTRRLAAPGLALDDLVGSFLAPPLYQTDVAAAFATIYTAVYRPCQGTVDFHWPERRWSHSFDGFVPGRHTHALAAP